MINNCHFEARVQRDLVSNPGHHLMPIRMVKYDGTSRSKQTQGLLSSKQDAIPDVSNPS